MKVIFYLLGKAVAGVAGRDRSARCSSVTRALMTVTCCLGLEIEEGF